MKKRGGFDLLRRYNEGLCTDEEKALVEAWYHGLEGRNPDPGEEEVNQAREATWQHFAHLERKARRFTFPYRYAAVGAVLIGSAFLVMRFFGDVKPDEPIAIVDERAAPEEELLRDAVPGGNKAILTLADGREVVLDEAKNGELARVDKVNIHKATDGLIVYETSYTTDASADEETAPLYNMISTPRGGQYRVVLPDGTNVWLNSASSLRYPVSFRGDIRSVELTGEAYFEVNKHQSGDEAVPFMVKTRLQTVRVLGTRFNVNAYEDEPTVNTTLLEGSVRVARGSGELSDKGLLLRPNHQAVLDGNRMEVNEVDAEEMIAWKNGYFSFDHADIKIVMRQLSRWYDVEVVYEGDIPPGVFSGKVYRNMNLSAVMEVLAFSRVNFRIEGKKITVFS